MERINEERMAVVMVTLNNTSVDEDAEIALGRTWACFLSYDEGVEMFLTIF